MTSRLSEIVDTVRQKVDARKSGTPLSALEERAGRQSAVISLPSALRRGPGEDLRVIGELKRRSPSAGDIRPDLDPVAVARELIDAGCAALSILTEPDYFGGSLETLVEVRAQVDRPLLRKDFIVGTYQVVEARACGADAVLLLAAVLDDVELAECAACAAQWGMQTLAEAHGEDELDRLLQMELPIVGVNARDLRTFEVDLSRALRWRDRIPADRIAVAESGVKTRDDAARVRDAGFDAVLCGEGLMRGGRPPGRFAELFGDHDA